MEHHIRHGRSAQPPSREGFTLVEVLVASLLFAVGMMAAMAMQYSVLGGFANTRDLSNATQIAERVAHIMKMESQQWRTAANVGNANLEPVYANAGGDTDIWSSDQALLERAATNDGWQPVFETPVDARLTHAGMRRYCAYVRAHQMANNSTSSGTQTGLVQAQIAVMYPSPDQSFPTTNTSSSGPTTYGSCTGFDTALNNLLQPATWGNVPEYEKQGYRVVHMGAHVVQRRHLSNGSGGRFGRFGS